MESSTLFIPVTQKRFFPNDKKINVIDEKNSNDNDVKTLTCRDNHEVFLIL